MKLPLAVSLICAATSAHAMQHPVPAGSDPHIQVARYDPSNPILLVGTVGRSVTISVGQSEYIRSVNLDTGYIDADKNVVPAPWLAPPAEQMKDSPAHVVPIWASRAGRSSASITTTTDDGVLRTYQFVLVALAPQPDDCMPGTDAQGATSDDLTMDCDDKRIAYGLSFIYPPEKPKVDQAAVQQAKADAALKWNKQKVQQKLAAEDRLKTDPYYGQRNWKYVAKGEKVAQATLVPDQISDNTAVTGMLFLGNRKVPTIYIVDPDGTERQVTPTVNKDLLVIQETAAHWRLRAGSQVADLFNVGYDPIGANPQTGTTSPEVVRVTREAAQK